MAVGMEPRQICRRKPLASLSVIQYWFHIGVLHLLLQTESVPDTRSTMCYTPESLTGVMKRMCCQQKE